MQASLSRMTLFPSSLVSSLLSFPSLHFTPHFTLHTSRFTLHTPHFPSRRSSRIILDLTNTTLTNNLILTFIYPTACLSVFGFYQAKLHSLVVVSLSFLPLPLPARPESICLGARFSHRTPLNTTTTTTTTTHSLTHYSISSHPISSSTRPS